MKYSLFKLYFDKGLRIGTGHIDESQLTIPADTLFSALVNETALSGNQEFFIQAVAENKLLLSDAFPFVNDHFLLPKPIYRIESEVQDRKQAKTIKKVDYIPFGQYKKFMAGKADPDELLFYQEQIGKVQTDTKIMHRTSPYNPINEEGQIQNQIYNLSYFRFKKEAGLYFIAACTEEYFDLLDETLYTLSFTGIGGKRSVGLGRFEMLSDDNYQNDLLMKKTDINVLISHAFPAETEIPGLTDCQKSYSLVRKGGFIYSESAKAAGYSTGRKRTQYFFRSGSVFNKPFKGDLFRVDDDFVHPVYRYGKAMWIGL